MLRAQQLPMATHGDGELKTYKNGIAKTESLRAGYTAIWPGCAERGRLDDIHTRRSPSGFPSPNSLSTVYSTHFII